MLTETGEGTPGTSRYNPSSVFLIMKTAFQYSRSNIVFLSVVFAIWLVGLILAPPKTPGGWGERMGTLTALWLFPTLFAWVFWRLTRRNHSVLSVTFNAVLTLSLFGQLTTLSGRARQAVALEKLKGEKSTLSANVAARKLLSLL